jgi:DNA-binding NtrC family response regulator
VSDGLRVLIVEDVAAAAEFVARRLIEGGIPCTPIQVATEKDFRAALRRLPPHLILSDLVLLEFDGLTALEIARKELPEVPFIFFSGTLGEEHAIEALRRGAFDSHAARACCSGRFARGERARTAA